MLYNVKVFWKKNICDLDIEKFTGFIGYDVIFLGKILWLKGNEINEYIMLDNVVEFEIEKLEEEHN